MSIFTSHPERQKEFVSKFVSHVSNLPSSVSMILYAEELQKVTNALTRIEDGRNN